MRRIPPVHQRHVTPPRKRRASVLVIVLITLTFAAAALVAFMDKASNDLVVDHREIVGRRLRAEAYSALEVTLAVLSEFRTVGGGLRSPADGWGDPLGFAEYTPGDGRKVDVVFEDESGKISLPRADAETLQNLFESWEVPKTDAEELTDALLGWMKREHVYTSATAPDYERGELPFEAPARPLRSYSELAAIEKVREFFYDANGQPNQYWLRFVSAVSLLDFERTNINGAGPDALAAIGRFDETQLRLIEEYTRGRGQFESMGPRSIRDPGEVSQFAGVGGNTQSFGAAIHALRIVITVHEGKSEFRVAAVVSWPNGARAITQTAQHAEVSVGANQAATQRRQAGSREQRRGAQAGGAQRTGTPGNPEQSLQYPFTLLEIHENDEIPAVPTPPAANPPL